MTAKMIAGCAGNTGAIGQKHQYLQAAGGLGYDPVTPQPSRRGQQLQNTVAGFCSLSHPYDESRRTPAVSAASLSVPPVLVARMGGLRACRFPQGVHGLQTCLSHLLSFAAREVVFTNRTPWRPYMAQSLTSVHTDLLVSIFPRAATRYHGTAAQLVAEGLIPDGFKWPHKASRTSFEMGEFTHWLSRCRPDGIKGPMSVWVEGDYWRLQRSLSADEGKGWQAAQLYEKSMELAELMRRNTPEWMRVFNRAWETRKDTKYQAFRQQLLGEPKRGRGRPAKTTTTQVTTQGATA